MQYYETVQDAFNAAEDGDTVGILNFDTTETKEFTVDKDLTIELLGSVPNRYSFLFRVKGSVTFISAGLSGGGPAAFDPIVVVENGGTLTAPEYYDSGKTAANAISFTQVLVKTGSSAVLGGGTYSILAADGGTVDLSGSSVQVGLTLSVQNGGTLIAENVKLSCSFGVYSGAATLTNCTVESDGIIASGSTVDGGTLTVNGSSSIVKNLTVKDGNVTATGGMLTGTLTVDGGAVNVTNAGVKSHTYVNAGTFTLGSGGLIDEHKLYVRGGEAIINGGTIENKAACDVIVESGKLTLRSGTIACPMEIKAGAQAELIGGRFGDVNVDGTLTVSGAEYENSYPGMNRRIYIHSGGEAKIHGGSCDFIHIYKGGKLTASGGSCSTLDVAAYCWDNVTLSGGSFGEIWVRAYEELEDQTVKKLDNIGYAQYAAMLAAGKGYRKSGGTFAGTADVTEDVYANPDYPYKVLQNVTVADAPFKGLHVTGDSSMTYGGSVMLTAEMDTKPANVTYQWYRNGTAISGETGASYTTDAALDARDYTYTVEATSNGYVTGASYTVTVEPKVIYPILDDSTLSKEYNGTATATVKITGFSFDIGGKTEDLLVSRVNYEITDPLYEDYNEKTTANASEAKKVRYTLKLNETNFALGKGYDTGAFYRTETNHAEVGDTAIKKASIGSYAISTKTITILNRHQKTYEIDLREYLPALASPRDFGGVTFTDKQLGIGRYYDNMQDPATVSGSTLTLPIVYVDSDTEGSAGEIQLTVHSANYRDFILKISVDAKNKLLPTGTATPDRTALIYGEKLSAIALSGEMSCNGTPVAGTFEWVNPDEVPEIGEYDADWTFEPAEDEKYLPVTGTVRITVSPATYSVTVAEAEHGSVSSNRRSASYGQTVTLTAAPEDGCVLETLTVTTRSGKEIALTDLGGGKYSFRMPGSRVTVAASFAEDNSVLNFFVDVPNDTFYYDAVKWAAENGITAGADALHFAPDRPCTRAEIAAFLWRAAGSPELERAADFADVDPDAYYAEAVAWAAENGVVLGTGTGFEPDRVCTRTEAVAMIYREIQRRGGGFTGAWMFRLPFTDTVDWAYEPTAWCYMHGITEGVSETEFGSNDPCTRAHIVTFLWRAFGE